MPSKDFDFHTETGRLSLNWIATLGDRNGVPIERLSNIGDLERWLHEIAGHRVMGMQTEETMSEAKRLRAAIIGLVDARYLGKTPKRRDIETVNKFAAAAPLPARLKLSGRSLEKESEISPATVFGQIARDAIDLVVSDDFEKIRSCAADDCSVYFIDYSRPGKRRWCSMSRCGNRVKKKKFIEKKLKRN